MAEPWIKKYQPKRILEIVGQKQAIADILRFIDEFPDVKKKALLLHGPSGVGKTCIIKALADEHDFELIELNASDVRNKASIETILGSATRQASLFGTKKIILVDEADGLSGMQDRGGATALADVIKETRFPIIITANDAYSKKLKTIRTCSQLIELKPINTISIVSRLKEICEFESIDYDEAALHKLAATTNGDLRAAINDLQVLSNKKEKITEDIIKLWGREQEEKIFNALKQIFKSFDAKKALEVVDNLDEEPKDLILWLDQNIPSEYYGKDELKYAYDNLSSADIFLNRIMRWQHWRFLVYVNLLSVLGVQQAKKTASRAFTMYQRPELLLKLFIRAMKMRKMKSISDQVSDKLHASSHELQKNFWPYYQFIVENNKDYAEELNEYLGL